jgi:hypothetical protein
MRVPRFRIAWVMVAVAIGALDFGAIRALLKQVSFVAGFLILGALPMANILVVGILTHVAQLMVARPRFPRESCPVGRQVFTTKRDRHSIVQVASVPMTPEFAPARRWAERPAGGPAFVRRSFPAGCHRQRHGPVRGG